MINGKNNLCEVFQRDLPPDIYLKYIETYFFFYFFLFIFIYLFLFIYFVWGGGGGGVFTFDREVYF